MEMENKQVFFSKECVLTDVYPLSVKQNIKDSSWQEIWNSAREYHSITDSSD